MDIRNRRALKETAGLRLAEAAYDPRKLALLHTAISLGAAFVIALIDYYLSNQIEHTGGLSGVGMRSLLGTVQTTLQYVLNLALPFWGMGFVYAALQMARSQRADFHSLPEGFRRFGPVLRLCLLEGLLYVGVGAVCMYAASFIFMLTPFGTDMTEKLMPVLEAGETIEQIEAAIAQLPVGNLLQMISPFLVIFGILFVVVAAFFFYRFRMANFIVMDQPRTSALQALILSGRMTRRKKMALLKLDLSFWWFYVLLALTAVISYGDLLLAQAGVTLPMPAEVAWFVFYILGMLAQLALYWHSYSFVQTTYAVAYDVLRQQMEEEPVVEAQPKKLPWDTYTEE